MSEVPIQPIQQDVPQPILIDDLVVSDPDWLDDAACVDANPDDFYPIAQDTEQIGSRICAHCSVQHDCLASAIISRNIRDHLGIRGGLTEQDREPFTRAYHIAMANDAEAVMPSPEFWAAWSGVFEPPRPEVVRELEQAETSEADIPHYEDVLPHLIPRFVTKEKVRRDADEMQSIFRVAILHGQVRAYRRLLDAYRAAPHPAQGHRDVILEHCLSWAKTTLAAAKSKHQQQYGDAHRVKFIPVQDPIHLSEDEELVEYTGSVPEDFEP